MTSKFNFHLSSNRRLHR